MISISNTEPTFSSLIYDLSLSSCDISLFTSVGLCELLRPPLLDSFLIVLCWSSPFACLFSLRIWHLPIPPDEMSPSSVESVFGYLQYSPDRVFLWRWYMQQFVISLFSWRLFTQCLSPILSVVCVVYLVIWPFILSHRRCGFSAMRRHICSSADGIFSNAFSLSVSSHLIFVCHSRFHSLAFSNASLVYDSRFSIHHSRSTVFVRRGFG